MSPNRPAGDAAELARLVELVVIPRPARRPQRCRSRFAVVFCPAFRSASRPPDTRSGQGRAADRLVGRSRSGKRSATIGFIFEPRFFIFLGNGFKLALLCRNWPVKKRRMTSSFSTSARCRP
jgi:hypothetical protein